jgi:hypothetical protein
MRLEIVQHTFVLENLVNQSETKKHESNSIKKIRITECIST